MHGFLNGFYINVMQFFVIGTILIFIALNRKSLNQLYAALLLIPLIFLDTALLSVIANYIFYKNSTLNFTGKFLEILWPLVLVFVFKLISPKEIGLKLPLDKMQLLYGVMVGSFMAILFFNIEKIWFVDLLPKNPTTIGTLVFEFLMPGLSEELVYRGVFLAILNRYLGYSWKLFNIQFGWGIVLVTILFVMAHDIVWIGNIAGIIELIVMALVYGFFREKINSIWPSVFCHSFANGVYYLLLF